MEMKKPEEKPLWKFENKSVALYYAYFLKKDTCLLVTLRCIFAHIYKM